jgi:hypothetical protein
MRIERDELKTGDSGGFSFGETRGVQVKPVLYLRVGREREARR